jgi:hypothetical protein
MNHTSFLPQPLPVTIFELIIYKYAYNNKSSKYGKLIQMIIILIVFNSVNM